MAAQVIRFYSPFILPIVSAILVHAVAQQLRALGENKPVPTTLLCVLKTPVVWAGIGFEVAISAMR